MHATSLLWSTDMKNAVNRLAKQTVVKIVSEGYLTGGDKYISKGSGVIIGRKDSVYYVLTANHISNHISNIDDELLVFIRSEKLGKAGEVLPLKFIKGYSSPANVLGLFCG